MSEDGEKPSNIVSFYWAKYVKGESSDKSQSIEQENFEKKQRQEEARKVANEKVKREYNLDKGKKK